ncbi:hypothetical protein ACFL6D_05525 [Spirochaetota bacterium]
MKSEDIITLQRELEQYKKDKEQIRNIVGQIGGKVSSKHDTIINIIFIALISILFTSYIQYTSPSPHSLLRRDRDTVCVN